MPDIDAELRAAGGASRPNEGPSAVASVLIVGAGPAALFAACELLRHGVRPRIVERRLAPHQEARGTAFQHALDRHLATYLVPEINPATAA